MPAYPSALKTRGQSEPRGFQACDIDLPGSMGSKETDFRGQKGGDPHYVTVKCCKHSECLSDSPRDMQRNTTDDSTFRTGVCGNTWSESPGNTPNPDSSDRC